MKSRRNAKNSSPALNFDFFFFNKYAVTMISLWGTKICT